MRSFDPAIGRPLPTSRRATESSAAAQAYDERQAFYNSRPWRLVSQAKLAQDQLCHWCGRLASMVDHIIPRLVRPDLAYELSNLRSCCRSCHAIHGEKDRGGGVAPSATP